MKKSLPYFVTIIITCILLSACNSKFLLKRHYRNGYYFSNTHKLTAPKSIDGKKLGIDEPTFKSPESNEMDRGDIILDYSINNEAFQGDMSNKYSANNEIKKSAVNYFELNKVESKVKVSKLSINKKNRSHVLRSIKSSNDNYRDGLSLFWIVIIVILILWLLGFLAGGFGLGGLINLLLVVALILLVLWLLRVI